MAAIPDVLASREAAPEVFTQRFPPLAYEGSALLAAVSVMWFLTTAWTGMRIVSRYLRKNEFQIEDYLYFVGYAFYCGLSITYILAVCVGGAGNDIGRLNAIQMHHYSRISLANQCMYSATLLFIKISIICMVRRVFGAAGKAIHIASFVTMGVVVIWALYTILIAFFLCLPVQVSWGAATPTSCGNQTVAISAVAVIDIISELMMVALPLSMLRGLQIPKAHKVGLYTVFGAGFITIVFSCLRLYYALNIDFNNVTKAFAVASVSSILQAGIAVMVASSPMLRPIFDRTVLRWLGISVRSTNKNTSNNVNGSRGPGVVSKAAVGASHRGTSGFRQITDSEEHLAWEMRNINGKGGGSGQTTTVQATRLSDDSSEGQPPVQHGHNHIMVTHETTIQR